MSDVVPRKRPPWIQVFTVGARVIDTDHPGWGVGEILTMPSASGPGGLPRGQVVKFSNGRHREYYPGFGKLTAADPQS